jgi:hypothetical protein
VIHPALLGAALAVAGVAVLIVASRHDPVYISTARYLTPAFATPHVRLGALRDRGGPADRDGGDGALVAGARVADLRAAMRRDQGEKQRLRALVDGSECGDMWERADRAAWRC